MSVDPNRTPARALRGAWGEEGGDPFTTAALLTQRKPSPGDIPEGQWRPKAVLGTEGKTNDQGGDGDS